MAAGRPKTPTKLKEIKGTLRKARELANEVMPNPELPAPPDHLGPEALVEWGRISEKLYRLGLLTEIDTSMLAMYCYAYGEHVKISRILKQVSEFDHVDAMVDNLIGRNLKWLEKASRLAAEFGMSPSSRSKAKPAEKEKPKQSNYFESV